MSQNPSGGDSHELIDFYKGLHDRKDSLFRPEGSVTAVRNIFENQAGDADRRPGRDFSSLQNGPVSLIQQLNWSDGGVSIITQADAVLLYDLSSPARGIVTAGLTDPTVPAPFPPSNPHPPFASTVRVPDFASLFRALSESYLFSTAGVSDINTISPIPALIWAFDALNPTTGAVFATNIRSKSAYLIFQSQGFRLRPTLAYGSVSPISPFKNSINDDFYWVNYVNQSSLIVSDLNYLISIYNTVKNNFLKTTDPEGKTTLDNFTGADDFSNSGMTTNQSASVLASLINNNLKRLNVAAGISNANTKSGSGITGLSCSMVNYKINGYSESWFTGIPPVAGLDFCEGSAFPAWDGIFQFQNTDGTSFCKWAAAPLDSFLATDHFFRIKARGPPDVNFYKVGKYLSVTPSECGRDHTFGGSPLIFSVTVLSDGTGIMSGGGHLTVGSSNPIQWHATASGLSTNPASPVGTWTLISDPGAFTFSPGTFTVSLA